MTASEINQRLNKFKPLNSVLDYKVTRLLLHYPYKLIYYYLYKKFIYQRTQRGKLRKVTTFFGDQMCIMLPASLDIFFFGLKSHPSEVALAKYILNNLGQGDTMVDIGAHFGYYTMLASRIVGEKGKVISVEASPETYKILKLNTAHTRNIEIKNMALCDVDDISIGFCVFPIFYSELNTLNPAQYEHSAWYKKVKGRNVEVPASTLTKLVERSNIRPKIIKIDVEGAENQVIKGAIDMLRSAHGTSVITEYINDSKSPAPYLEAESILKGIGYLPHYILQDGTLKAIQGEVLEFMREQGLVSENIVYRKAD